MLKSAGIVLPDQTGHAGDFLTTDGTTTSWAPASGGDVIGPISSVDNEIALFSGTTGQTIKSATGTGYVKVISGVFQTPSSTIPNTDITGLGTMSTQNANSVAITGGTAVLSFLRGSTGGSGTIASNTAVNDQLLLAAHNTTSGLDTTFITFTSGSTATCDLSDSVTKAGQYIYRAGGTDVAVADGGLGISTIPSNGQIPIGNGSGYIVANIAGTTNQVNVTNGAGSITLSLPQNINTGATPTFVSANLSGIANTSVLFINGSTIAGDATNFNYNSTTHALTITGDFSTSGAFLQQIGQINLKGNNAFIRTGTNSADNFGVKIWDTSVNTYRTFIQAAAGNPTALTITNGGGSGLLGIDGASITNGTIDGAVIGGSTPAAGTFTQVVATGSSAGTVKITALNSNNTGSVGSSAFVAQVGGANAGDAYFNATVNSISNWSWGLRNSDSDSLHEGPNAGLGFANDTRIVTLSGQQTMPLQPAFLAVNTVNRTNVTGDGTAYTIQFNSTIFDQGSNFNTTTGTFTAPVTGRYQLNTNVLLGSIATTMTVIVVAIVTSNRTYQVQALNGSAKDNNSNLILNGSVLADMDAGDTATVTITASNGTKVAQVTGTGANTSFSGFLAC